MSPGRVSVGLPVSRTVIPNEPVAVSFPAFVAVQVTVVSPIGKRSPELWSQLGVTVGSLLVTSNETVAPPLDVASAVMSDGSGEKRRIGGGRSGEQGREGDHAESGQMRVCRARLRRGLREQVEDDRGAEQREPEDTEHRTGARMPAERAPACGLCRPALRPARGTRVRRGRARGASDGTPASRHLRPFSPARLQELPAAGEAYREPRARGVVWRRAALPWASRRHAVSPCGARRGEPQGSWPAGRTTGGGVTGATTRSARRAELEARQASGRVPGGPRVGVECVTVGVGCFAAGVSASPAAASAGEPSSSRAPCRARESGSWGSCPRAARSSSSAGSRRPRLGRPKGPGNRLPRARSRGRRLPAGERAGRTVTSGPPATEVTRRGAANDRPWSRPDRTKG